MLQVWTEYSGIKSGLANVTIVFVLHLTLFPDHLGSLSFMLSWGAFLILDLMNRAKISHVGSLVVLCVACQMWVESIKGTNSVSYGIKTIFANVLMVPLFEKVIFPMGSVLIMGALGAWVWKSGGVMGGDDWRQIFDCFLRLHEFMAQVVLGGLQAIRYI